MKDTDLVPFQRALSGAGRRVSRSSGTIPLRHIPIFEVGSFVKRLKKKGIIEDYVGVRLRGTGFAFSGCSEVHSDGIEEESAGNFVERRLPHSKLINVFVLCLPA